MKTLIWVGMFIGSIIGGYIPVLFGADFISFASVFWSGVGAIIGIIAGYKVAQALGI